PGSLQGKISSDGCLKKEQMVVSAIASTPHLPSFMLIRNIPIDSKQFQTDIISVDPPPPFRCAGFCLFSPGIHV
ncbi:hypothetical protein ACOY1P_004764, partial [Escherichia coli]